MHKQLFRLLFLLTISLAVFCNSSCKKLTQDPDVANALIGQWRVSQTSVDIFVGGVDLVQYLVSNLGYNQDDAEAISDSIISEISTNSRGTIVFNGDKTYQLSPDNQDEEKGTWSVSADGKILNLDNETEIAELKILSITAQSLILQLPTDSEDVDFNNDGIDETSMDINIEQTLSKSSNGGAGG